MLQGIFQQFRERETVASVDTGYSSSRVWGNIVSIRRRGAGGGVVKSE